MLTNSLSEQAETLKKTFLLFFCLTPLTYLFEFQTSEAHKTYTNWKCLELIMHSPHLTIISILKSLKATMKELKKKSETIQRFPPVSDWSIQTSYLAVHVLDELVSAPETVIKLPVSDI